MLHLKILLFWHATKLQGLIILSPKFDLSAVFTYADDIICIVQEGKILRMVKNERFYQKGHYFQDNFDLTV